MALAAGLSWYLATLISPHPNPYFAPLAVVITFQTTVADTVAKAWYRSAGIIGGVAASLLIGHWLHVGPAAIALAVLVGVAISTALRLDPQITSQVGVTAVMVLASSATPHYAEYRVLETLLGEVVAVAVNALLLPPNGLAMAERRVLAVADRLSDSLLSLAGVSQAPHGALLQPTARQIQPQMRSAFQALRAAQSSLKLNPLARAGRARIGELALAMGELEKAGIQVIGIARGLDDLGPETDPGRTGLNEALKDTAEAVAAFRRALANPSGESLQAVEAAVARAQCTQMDCLATLRATASLTELRDLYAIFADVSRILTEVSVDFRKQSGQVPAHPSIAFGHD